MAKDDDVVDVRLEAMSRRVDDLEERTTKHFHDLWAGYNSFKATTTESVEKIRDRLQNRLPNWTVFVMQGMTALIVLLGTLLGTLLIG